MRMNFTDALMVFLSFFFFLNFTILYWFCQISKWIRHRYTCVPHPEPSSLLPPHTIPLGRPSAAAPSIQYRALNLCSVNSTVEKWQIYIMSVFLNSPPSSSPTVSTSPFSTSAPLFSSAQFSHSVMSNSLWPHEPQHTRPPCPSPTPGVYPNLCPLSWWCHLTISSSCPLLLLPSIFHNIRAFSNESALHIR